MFKYADTPRLTQFQVLKF